MKRLPRSARPRTVATAGNLAETVRITKSVLERVDAACSRFRNDSDLSRLNACAGSFVQIGPDLAEALAVAIDAARVTGGAVDPTIGNSLINLGYDRTFEDISQSSGFDGVCRPAPAWEAIEVRNNGSEVRVPVGVRLDLGATAKALAADKCAQLAASAIGLGVLVSIGGDIAVSGTAPERGWVVGIADSHRTAFAESDEAVVFSAGGLATSSTTVRRWRSGEAALHHIVDPTTGGRLRSSGKRSVSLPRPVSPRIQPARRRLFLDFERRRGSAAWVARRASKGPTARLSD